MNNKTFKKDYIALVDGILNKKTDLIDAPISRKENSIIERCVNKNGDNAITNYFVIKEFNDTSLVHISLQTGRTHQIRVHMSYIGHPITGDTLYGKKSSYINRQALHACKVCFIHPLTKQKMNLEADLPTDIKNFLSHNYPNEKI